MGTAPPLNELTLPEGKHQIIIRNEDFPPYSASVNVAPASRPRSSTSSDHETPLRVFRSAFFSPPAPRTAAAPPAMDVPSGPPRRRLLAGIRAYEDAQYAEARSSWHRVESRPASPRTVRGPKTLAFIYCTSNRTHECEPRSAPPTGRPGVRAQQVGVGPPLWGPVYKRVCLEFEAVRRG
jgi:hypothetical protein